MNGNDLMSIWKAENEAQGILLRKILKEEGIQSELRSDQIPWMDGIMQATRGYWGEIMVLQSDAQRATEAIETYLGGKQTDEL